MSTKNVVNQGQRRFYVLLVAGLLAIASFALPMALDGAAGTALVSQAYACQNPTGGC